MDDLVNTIAMNIVGVGMGIGLVQSYRPLIKPLLQAYRAKPSRMATADITKIIRLGRAVNEWNESQIW